MWISVTLHAPADAAERLSEALMAGSALSVAIEDAAAGTDAEQPQFGEPGHHPASLWSNSAVIALFDADADIDGQLQHAAHEAGLAAVPEHTREDVAPQNWVELTQSQFAPIRITPSMWI